jgi:cytoskeletal protein RodZ
MPGIVGPTAGGGGHAPSFIQGPVAGGTGAPYLPPQPPTASAKKERRVASYRVFAIILAVFMLAGTAVVLAVWFGAGMVQKADQPTAAKDPPVVADAQPAKPSRRTEDTGTRKQKPEPDKPKPRSRPATGSTTAPAPKPAAAPGTLKVKMGDQTFLTAVEVICTSGTQKRVSISPGGSATLSGIPAGEVCTLFFKGSTNARFTPVTAGQSLTCTIQGTTAVCQ